MKKLKIYLPRLTPLVEELLEREKNNKISTEELREINILLNELIRDCTLVEKGDFSTLKGKFDFILLNITAGKAKGDNDYVHIESRLESNFKLWLKSDGEKYLSVAVESLGDDYEYHSTNGN